MTWKPIASAPKGLVVLGTWVTSWDAVPRLEAVSQTDDGQWQCYDGDVPQEPPTHWMPLPDRPSKVSEETRTSNYALALKLREKTGHGMRACISAVTQAKGDADAAEAILLKWERTLW